MTPGEEGALATWNVSSSTIVSSMLMMRATLGLVMPKSASVTGVVAVPVATAPFICACTSQTAGRVTPCTVRSPTS